MAEEQKDNVDKPMDVLEKYGLTLEQEMFCQYFTSPTEFFGNGVQSYASAYGFDITDARSYNTAKSSASRLLTNENVLRRINDLLDTAGFNDTNADKQLLFLMNQSADMKTKLGGIKEYNRLKGRITDKLDMTTNGAPITSIQIIPIPAKDHGLNTPSTETRGS